MAFRLPKWFQNLWKHFNLRSAILISLSLQILLIFVASSRRRTGNKIVALFIWSAYLLADWFAAFAIGLISNAIGSCEKPTQSEDLLAFWTPFLLLHLGGPDTIIAFSLEDNELWLRHLLSLLIQLVAVAYVLLQTLPNEFVIPTTLMFFAGFIKYAERTRALYLACLDNFKSSMLTPPDAGPNYAQLMEEYSSKKEAGIPVQIKIISEPNKDNAPSGTEKSPSRDQLNDIEVVQYGHKFFNIFKGLIVDLMFSFHERKESRNFFFNIITTDAFKVMEVELNFLYDVLYTKMAVVHNKIGCFLCCVCSVCIAISLERFVSHTKHNIHKVDKGITSALLIGAMGLDFIALIKLVFSDWTVVLLKNAKAKSLVSNVHEKLSFYKHWTKNIQKSTRWSNTFSQYSLINYCLKKRIKLLDKTADFLGVKDSLVELLYKKTLPIEESSKAFIFEELKEKTSTAEDSKTAMEICSRRGDGVLSKSIYFSLERSVEVEYDQRLLPWHIATELCYHKTEENNSEEKDAQICKKLSEYMLYLLVMQPTMMSAVAGIGQIRFQDTCEEAKKFLFKGQVKPHWFTPVVAGIKKIKFLFFSTTCIKKIKKVFCGGQSESKEARDGQQSKSRVELNMHEACQQLLSVDTAVKPNEVKGDRSKSVLFDACILAKELRKLRNEDRWKIMSQVWVELLSYAASHCRADTHAQRISKGGELISFVWLLMAHFGLGEQFRIEAGHARAKIGGK